MRPVLPSIPDFTTAVFHKDHSDTQMQLSILGGKGTLMPANRGRLTEDQAGSLVAVIRAFRPSAFADENPPGEWEFKSASFGGDEKENTKSLFQKPYAAALGLCPLNRKRWL